LYQLNFEGHNGEIETKHTVVYILHKNVESSPQLQNSQYAYSIRS